MKKIQIVNKKADSKIQRRVARKQHPKNIVVTNTRGGIRQ